MSDHWLTCNTQSQSLPCWVDALYHYTESVTPYSCMIILSAACCIAANQFLYLHRCSRVWVLFPQPLLYYIWWCVRHTYSKPPVGCTDCATTGSQWLPAMMYQSYPLCGLLDPSPQLICLVGIMIVHLTGCATAWSQWWHALLLTYSPPHLHEPYHIRESVTPCTCAVISSVVFLLIRHWPLSHVYLMSCTTTGSQWLHALAQSSHPQHCCSHTHHNFSGWMGPHHGVTDSLPLHSHLIHAVASTYHTSCVVSTHLALADSNWSPALAQLYVLWNHVATLTLMWSQDTVPQLGVSDTLLLHASGCVISETAAQPPTSHLLCYHSIPHHPSCGLPVPHPGVMDSLLLHHTLLQELMMCQTLSMCGDHNDTCSSVARQ